MVGSALTNFPLHFGGEWVSASAEYSLSDEHSELEPPDPISNSEVKRLSADGSVGFPHVRVGHRQACQIGRAHV